jgi:hypothetical protein
MTEFGQRQAALVPQLPRLRLAAAALILATTLIACLWLAQFREWVYNNRHGVQLLTPGWALPVAIAVGVAGAVALLSLCLHRSRLVVAAVIVGAAIAGIAWVSTYEILTPEGRVWLFGFPPAGAVPQLYASPGWAVPVAVLIGISAIGASAFVLRRH